MPPSSILLKDERETLHYGKNLARLLTNGVLFLQGELGAGKTTVCKGIIAELGYAGVVKSPTYTLMETYQCNHLNVCHFDLYRLTDASELEYIGGREYFDSSYLCLVEWPERGIGWLPKPNWVLNLRLQGLHRTAEWQVNDIN